ncbi:SAM-dependent methyltransferase [Pseudorhodoferax soli]|uniref:Methyltransferase family protein n=1 Tax=Pseudorhodoferax soli TaxID=545864 RepID=A0A368XJM8_9BURK|nr:methyltransferase domain-containing protein [Pseudorhodoferax soli]RCW68250.1 methyltransferase family protein [Pseudorhodoferax soli]
MLRSRTALVCAALATSLAAPAHALEEVPFVTSPDNVTLEMLRIAQVGPQDRLIDLGSGDGRIVIVAAQRFGASGLGVEIVPDLVRQSQENARIAGVADRAQFRVEDIFQTDLSGASVITMYLLPDVNLALRPRLLALKPGTRIVSHDWDMGDWKPDQTTVLPVPDKKVGLEKTSKVQLWTVPAQVHGLWCGAGMLGGMRFEVKQSFQQFTAMMTRGGRVREYAGRIEGDTLHSLPGARTQMQLRLQGEQLVLAQADGALGLLKGAALARSSGEDCAD